MTPANVIGFGRKSGATPPAPPRGLRHDVVRIDSTRGRYYEITDRDTGEVTRVPSVTHVLEKGLPKGPALLRWIAQTDRTAALEAAADLHAELVGHPQLPRALYLAALDAKVGKAKASEKARDAAALVGSAAHDWVAWDLKRRCGIIEREPALSVPAQHAIGGYLAWVQAHTIEPLAVEQVVYSLRYELAGTLDCLARIDGVVTVLDLKTGKAVYPEALLQTGCYGYALLEMGVVDTTPAGVVLRLPKRTTDPAFEAVPVPMGEAMPVMLAARAIWAWSEAHERAYRARTAARTAETTTAMATAAEPIRAAVPAEAVTLTAERWPAVPEATAPVVITAAHSGTAPIALTHYSPYSGRSVTAICGAWLPAQAVTTVPTCATCAAYVAQVDLDAPPF